MLQIPEQPTEEQVLDFLKTVLINNPLLFTNEESHQHDAGCFMRAFRLNEPTFTVRAQDSTSAQTVAYWLGLNAQLNPERVDIVSARVIAMEKWPTKKIAD